MKACVAALALALLAIGDVRAQAPPATQRHGKLFPPLDLGLLERPDRALWQKPDEIMDALHVADGSTVADVGAGAGWFTIRLAQRVGPKGVVYAQDVQPQMVEAIRRRVSREGLQNVKTVRGEPSDPKLPRGMFDAVLLVDAYQEIDNRAAYLQILARALKPKGLIGIVNWKPGRGGPGPDPNERVERSLVETDAAAAKLRVVASENLPYQYLLVLAP